MSSGHTDIDGHLLGATSQRKAQGDDRGELRYFQWIQLFGKRQGYESPGNVFNFQNCKIVSER